MSLRGVAGLWWSHNSASKGEFLFPLAQAAATRIVTLCEPYAHEPVSPNALASCCWVSPTIYSSPCMFSSVSMTTTQSFITRRKIKIIMYSGTETHPPV